MEWIKSKKIYADYPRPKKFDYNLVVIGAGAAGLVSSYIASAVKAKVALIEENRMGGDCLNTGCVPSKALIHMARIAHAARTGAAQGLLSTMPDIDFGKAIDHVNSVKETMINHIIIMKASSYYVH